MVTMVAVVTALVLMANVPEVPEGIVRLAGTTTAEELLVKLTTAPEVGAAPLRFTVPVRLVPPVTLGSLRLIDERTGSTVKTELATALGE
jgi:hypothetical protein